MDGLAFTLLITFFVFGLAVLGAFCLRGRTRYTNEKLPYKAPVVVTSTTHTAPGGYPVTQVPPPGVYQQQPMYPPYPTPASGPGQMPMPMPMPMPGAQPPMSGVQPYPPAVPATTYNPPSYDAAVAGVGVAQPNNSYEKQAPYNPNYNAY